MWNSCTIAFKNTCALKQQELNKTQSSEVQREKKSHYPTYLPNIIVNVNATIGSIKKKENYSL